MKPTVAGARGALLASILLLSACASHITPQELRKQIESGNAPTILDVRSRGEFESGHIPGALHFPFWTMAGNLDDLPPEAASGPVVLYCEHGPRAGIARAQIWFASTGTVFYLQGHMTAWRSAGLPIYPED